MKKKELNKMQQIKRKRILQNLQKGIEYSKFGLNYYSNEHSPLGDRLCIYDKVVINKMIESKELELNRGKIILLNAEEDFQEV